VGGTTSTHQKYWYDANITLTCDYDNRLTGVSGGAAGSYSQVSYAYDAAGNTTTFEDVSLAYTDTAHVHGVTGVAGEKRYWYDANGNVTRRISGTLPSRLDINLTYDYDNRLTAVSGGAACTYIYDGDGNLVKMTIGGATTALVGKHFEITGSITKTYYYAGATRIATREGSTYYFLLTDHLGSTAVTATSAGANQADLRYRAYGMARLKSGTQKTPYRYTGQRIEAGIDLYYYSARWYDPVAQAHLCPACRRDAGCSAGRRPTSARRPRVKRCARAHPTH
jgi:hypothetical protein